MTTYYPSSSSSSYTEASPTSNGAKPPEEQSNPHQTVIISKIFFLYKLIYPCLAGCPRRRAYSSTHSIDVNEAPPGSPEALECRPSDRRRGQRPLRQDRPRIQHNHQRLRIPSNRFEVHLLKVLAAPIPCLTTMLYSDIHSIPVELRTVLENCLAEEPSPEVLVSFMPDLRKVLYKLLKGLQSREDIWRTASHSRGGSRSSLDSR